MDKGSKKPRNIRALQLWSLPVIYVYDGGI